MKRKEVHIKTIKKGETWLVESDTSVGSLTIEDGAVIAAPEGKWAIMTVNGEAADPVPGTYTGVVTLDIK